MAKNRSVAKFWQRNHKPPTDGRKVGKLRRKKHLHGLPCADVRPRREPYWNTRHHHINETPGIPCRVTKGKEPMLLGGKFVKTHFKPVK